MREGFSGTLACSTWKGVPGSAWGGFILAFIGYKCPLQWELSVTTLGATGSIYKELLRWVPYLAPSTGPGSWLLIGPLVLAAGNGQLVLPGRSLPPSPKLGQGTLRGPVQTQFQVKLWVDIP